MGACSGKSPDAALRTNLEDVEASTLHNMYMIHYIVLSQDVTFCLVDPRKCRRCLQYLIVFEGGAQTRTDAARQQHGKPWSNSGDLSFQRCWRPRGHTAIASAACPGPIASPPSVRCTQRKKV